MKTYIIRRLLLLIPTLLGITLIVFLSMQAIPGDPVEVSWNGRTVRRRPRPSRLVLLTEFAERFDRTFLPIAEMRVP